MVAMAGKPQECLQGSCWLPIIFILFIKLRSGTPLMWHMMFNFVKAEFGEGKRACQFCKTLGRPVGVGRIFVFAVGELSRAEGLKAELCTLGAFVWCPGGARSLGDTDTTGQGSCVLPDPPEHGPVFLQPGLLGAVSQLLLFLFSSCLLSSMFKAVCAFIFAQLRDP